MASSSSFDDSSIPDPLETTPVTAIQPSTEMKELQWIWFVVPFATALILFICFDCLVIVLLCRRNRYRKAHQLLFTDDGKPMYSADNLNESVTLSGFRGLRTSINSSHGSRGHFASSEYCSVCGNTASRDLLTHYKSNFRGYRDHRRHTRDGMFLYGEPLDDRMTFPSTMDYADSYEGTRYAGEPSYNPPQVSRAFRELSSVSDIYTVRSTDEEDDTYTPRFTPTVSRSISEDLDGIANDTASLSSERSGRQVATQAQNYDYIYRRHRGNSFGSCSTSSNDQSDDQLVHVKSIGKTVVKTNGYNVNNLLNSYFVKRRGPVTRQPTPAEPVVRDSVPITNDFSVTVETDSDYGPGSNTSTKLQEHNEQKHFQEQDENLHFIESYLASSYENVAITAFSYV